MSDILDQDQRLQALDPERSFIVQAPAGSGKTELLTQRFLRLLGRVEQPEEIVAITFTRKAAAEMRNRILAALDSAAGACPEEAHKRHTWELANEALTQDRRHQWHLRVSPNRLRIQTFDSLCASLARQLPLLSQMGAPPRTREDAAALYQDAARATLARLQDSELHAPLATVLRHLDNQLAQLEQLLVQMLGRRDQWLPHMLRSHDIDALEEALTQLIEEQLARLDRYFSAAQMTELVRLAGFAAEHLPEDRQTDPRLAPLMLWRERHFRPDVAWDDLPLWHGLARLVLTDKGEPRARVNKNDGFPAEQKAAKQEIAGLIAELAQEPALIEQLHATRRFPLQRFDPAQRELLEALRRILMDAAAQLDLVFQEQGELDFIEVQLRALRALGQPDEPSELALLLDYRIQHLLVDEFQDTSIGQYQLLERLTAGWQPGDGRSLFVVGDPMQSIYRFRKAEVSLFLQARQQGLQSVPLDALRLQMNFRSHEQVVEWVNECFSQLFPEAVDITLGAMPYAASVASRPAHAEAGVRVHAYPARDDETEASDIAALVQRTLAEDPQGSIAVLARARAHLHAIASALQDAGLAYQAVQVDPLASRPTVQDLHALTRALLHPADRLAWLSLLRSPLVGMQLADLVLLCSGDRDTPVWQLLNDPARLDTLGPDGRVRAQRLREILHPDLPARFRRPLRDWIESVWLALGGVQVGNPDDARAYLMLLAAQQQQHGIADFGALEQALAQLFAPPDNAADGRIQLMTMHQAKGLEFDTVILPGLGRRPPPDRSELLYWLELPEESAETALLMAPIKSSGQDAEPISDYIRWINRRKQELEDLRLLYVAATRARRQLHLCGHVRFNKKGEYAPEGGSLLDRLWPALQDEFCSLTPPADETAGRSWRAGPGEELRVAADWHLQAAGETAAPVEGPASQAQAIDFEWAGDTARHVGTLTHRYLERVGSEGLAQWTAERLDAQRGAIHTGLAALGVDPGAQDAACDKVLRALRQTLAHDQGRWLLSAHEHAACELPLTMLDDDDQPRQYVIDRTFVAEGTRWIVDYKTGEHLGADIDAFLDREQERYREQLETYARAMRLREGRPVKLALYFPLIQAWRVWDAAE